ncbi:hypothetical protein, partial [Bradyrhizobium liaoningense]|uniref:hypothetical protein n=1 Tax=Bradyrhizobium liaoningense TaxID=43992 RepID=UPI001AEC3987
QNSGELRRETAKQCLPFEMRVGRAAMPPLLRHCERSDLSAEAFSEDGSKPESFHSDSLDCFVARAPRNAEEERAWAKLHSRAPDAAQRPFDGALQSRGPC